MECGRFEFIDSLIGYRFLVLAILSASSANLPRGDIVLPALGSLDVHCGRDRVVPVPQYD